MNGADMSHWVLQNDKNRGYYNGKSVFLDNVKTAQITDLRNAKHYKSSKMAYSALQRATFSNACDFSVIKIN